MLLMLPSCQTYGVKLPKALSKPCPEVGFIEGKLMPQIVTLKTEYELCKANNAALILLFNPDYIELKDNTKFYKTLAYIQNET